MGSWINGWHWAAAVTEAFNFKLQCKRSHDSLGLQLKAEKVIYFVLRFLTTFSTLYSSNDSQKMEKRKAAPAVVVALAPALAPAVAKTIFSLWQRQTFPPQLHDYNINLLCSALPPCLYSSIKKAQMRFRFFFCPLFSTFSGHFLPLTKNFIV